MIMKYGEIISFSYFLASEKRNSIGQCAFWFLCEHCVISVQGTCMVSSNSLMDSLSFFFSLYISVSARSF